RSLVHSSLTEAVTSELYTLSLHDALPICGGAMVEERKGAHGICRGVEDQLRPLRAPCVFDRDNLHAAAIEQARKALDKLIGRVRDRKSTRLNSSHVSISYAVFCLKKKKQK